MKSYPYIHLAICDLHRHSYKQVLLPLCRNNRTTVVVAVLVRAYAPLSALSPYRVRNVRTPPLREEMRCARGALHSEGQDEDLEANWLRHVLCSEMEILLTMTCVPPSSAAPRM